MLFITFNIFLKIFIFISQTPLCDFLVIQKSLKNHLTFRNQASVYGCDDFQATIHELRRPAFLGAKLPSELRKHQLTCPLSNYCKLVIYTAWAWCLDLVAKPYNSIDRFQVIGLKLVKVSIILEYKRRIFYSF